jgi:alpha-beta hydrolase superfamily lysophospholipase
MHREILLKTVMITVMVISAMFSSCARLDGYLFNGKPLDAYQLETYTGETECTDAMDTLAVIDTSYNRSQVREITMATGNGIIYGQFLSRKQPRCDSSDTMILYFHGKSNHIDYYWPRTRLLYATGYSVLVIDYQGFGKSPGTPTEAVLYDDGTSALRFIRDSLGNPEVVVYAFSLGSLIGCKVASEAAGTKIIELVLEAPIGSIQSIVDDATYLNLPATYVTSYTSNNAERIKKVTCPFLWMHGTMDETLPRETNGLPIWENYTGSEGYYIWVEGASHATIPTILGYARYIGCVRSFIQNNVTDPIMIKK